MAPEMELNDNIVCVPGDRLCLADEKTIGGAGTYERDGYIYANLPGVINQWKEDKFVYVEVKNDEMNVLVPFPGDIVTARVITVTKRFVNCLIIAVNKESVDRPFRAILRKHQVTTIKPDAVELTECFRPGDIILAKVLPFIELFIYQLSTADRGLGVVTAVSKSNREHEGPAMIPVNWKQMQCPSTHVKESRKIAMVSGNFEDINCAD